MNWPRDYAIVKVPSIFIDESRFKGFNGQAILMDVIHNPSHHVRTYGIVVSVPSELCGEPIFAKATGLPGYEYNPGFEFVRVNQIELEVNVGDKIYFHFACLKPDLHLSQFSKNFMFSELDRSGPKPMMWYYFKIDYRLIFAAVRYTRLNTTMKEFTWQQEGDIKVQGPVQSLQQDGTIYQRQLCVLDDYNSYWKEIRMIGSYVLIEPDKESWEDISIPLPAVGKDGKVILDGKTGKPVMKPKEQWMVTKSHPEDRYLCGWIRYVGTPLKGFSCSLTVGMYVYFRYFTDTPLAFEGEPFFRMRQNYIGMYDPFKKRITSNESRPAEAVSEPAG